jgi:hypothetical protein
MNAAHQPRESAGEEYTLERKAEFLLNNSVDETDYQAAREEVIKLGLNPDQVPHRRPTAH